MHIQGLRVILVAVQVGAVKTIYVAAMEALRKNERQDETEFTTPKKKKKTLMVF
jgi:NADH:ubiquinone oxidoreductase subunit 6 (subunit J)